MYEGPISQALLREPFTPEQREYIDRRIREIIRECKQDKQEMARWVEKVAKKVFNESQDADDQLVDALT